MDKPAKAMAITKIDENINIEDEVFLLPDDYKAPGTDTPVREMYDNLNDDSVIIMRNFLKDGELRLIIIP